MWLQIVWNVKHTPGWVGTPNLRGIDRQDLGCDLELVYNEAVPFIGEADLVNHKIRACQTAEKQPRILRSYQVPQGRYGSIEMGCVLVLGNREARGW